MAAPGSCCSMWILSCSMWDLVLLPGIKPGHALLETPSLSLWTTREFPLHKFLPWLSVPFSAPEYCNSCISSPSQPTDSTYGKTDWYMLGSATPPSTTNKESHFMAPWPTEHQAQSANLDLTSYWFPLPTYNILLPFWNWSQIEVLNSHVPSSYQLTYHTPIPSP